MTLQYLAYCLGVLNVMIWLYLLAIIPLGDENANKTKKR